MLKRSFSLLILSFFISITGFAQRKAGNVNFILLDEQVLQSLYNNYHKGDAATVEQVNKLIKQADTLLNEGHIR